jgi:hypothetical protein
MQHIDFVSRLNPDAIERMSQMSPEGHQHLRKVARQRDASQAHARFRLAQAEADTAEAKERCEAAKKAKGKAVERQAFLEAFKPILDLNRLQKSGSGGDTAKRIQTQIMWHRRIGGDVNIPTGVHKMKKTEAWVIMVQAVRRHLSGTSANKGNPFVVPHQQRMLSTVQLAPRSPRTTTISSAIPIRLPPSQTNVISNLPPMPLSRLSSMTPPTPTWTWTWITTP